MEIRRTDHFKTEQAADDITEAEIVLAWTRPELERPSQEHLGALVRTSTMADGSRVTVVTQQSETTLIFITTWRH